MILANLSVPIMGLADTAMLGHLEHAAFMGAVAVGANIFAFMFWMLAFLRMGTTAIVGQAAGARTWHTAQDHLVRSLGLALALAVLLIATQFVTLPLALRLVAADPQVYQLAEDYAAIRIYAAPAVLLNYVLNGWFIGLQRPLLPLAMTLLANSANIGLDWLFILHWHWGSEGAAAASVCADFLGLTVGLVALRHTLRPLPPLRWMRALRAPDWGRLLSLNGDLFVRTAVLLFVFNFFTAQSGRLGQEALAANAVLMQLILFTSFAMDGYAHAAETLVAHARGAGDRAALMRACGATTLMALLIATVFALAFAALQPHLVALMTDIPGVRDELAIYWTWLCLMPLVSVWSYMLDGIFIGAGETRLLRNWMLFCVLCIFLPVWYFSRHWQNHGLWAAFVLFNGARGVTLAAAFFRRF